MAAVVAMFSLTPAFAGQAIESSPISAGGIRIDLSSDRWKVDPNNTGKTDMYEDAYIASIDDKIAVANVSVISTPPLKGLTLADWVGKHLLVVGDDNSFYDFFCQYKAPCKPGAYGPDKAIVVGGKAATLRQPESFTTKFGPRNVAVVFLENGGRWYFITVYNSTKNADLGQDLKTVLASITF